MEPLSRGFLPRKGLPRSKQKLNEIGPDVHKIKGFIVKSILEDPCPQCFFVKDQNNAKVLWNKLDTDCTTSLYATCPGSGFIIEHFLAQQCSNFVTQDVSKNFVRDVSCLEASYVHDSRIVSSSSSTVCEMCEKHEHHTFTKNCSPQLCFWFSMPSVQIENKTVTLEEFLTKEAKEEEDIKTSM